MQFKRSSVSVAGYSCCWFDRDGDASFPSNKCGQSDYTASSPSRRAGGISCRIKACRVKRRRKRPIVTWLFQDGPHRFAFPTEPAENGFYDHLHTRAPNTRPARGSIKPRISAVTVCPIALVVGCKKCPAFSVCPLKGVIGDYRKQEDSQTKQQADDPDKK